MMIDNSIDYGLKELEERSGAECARLLYEAAIHGEEIERQIKEFILSEYLLACVYCNGKWWSADRREGTSMMEAIHNPATKRGEFPDLTSLLKWCIENRS